MRDIARNTGPQFAKPRYEEPFRSKYLGLAKATESLSQFAELECNQLLIVRAQPELQGMHDLDHDSRQHQGHTGGRHRRHRRGCHQNSEDTQAHHGLGKENCKRHRHAAENRLNRVIDVPDQIPRRPLADLQKGCIQISLEQLPCEMGAILGGDRSLRIRKQQRKHRSNADYPDQHLR